MNDTRRIVLDALASGPTSGPTLAARASVSRAAIWKQIQALRAEGFTIESDSDGYAIVDAPAYGSAAAIEFGLQAPYEVEFHDALESTNLRGRELAEAGRENVVVIADRQTGGRGRLDRSWSSPPGGVWVSIVLRPTVPPAHAPMFTLVGALAAVEAIRSIDVAASIKWPNDVLVSDAPDAPDRKVSGILTEMEGEADRVSWLVVGIGLNADVDASKLPAGATSLREITGETVDRGAIARTLLESFAEYVRDLDSVLDAWRRYNSTIGNRVRIDTPTGTIEGTAVDVVSPGALVVDTGTEQEVVHAGDCEHLRPR
ncbi:MAG: biotin--[acetyl-CoA-carboxylase] ligase [Halobacteriota archaeon]